jgi:hypothetical protein
LNGLPAEVAVAEVIAGAEVIVVDAVAVVAALGGVVPMVLRL